jgi:TolB protein
VAFVSPRTGNDDIYLLAPLTGQIANLTAHPAEDRNPAWSPDGTRLAFASNRDGNWELYLWSTADGSITRLTADPAYDGAPAWSPDGTHLAFESYRDGNLEIYLLDLGADSAPVRLTENQAGDYAPAWSPDGRYVAFSSWRDGDKEIYLADLEDDTVRNLTNRPAAEDEAPAWSPDGTIIAFVSWRYGNVRLYTMRTDGSQQWRVTANDVYDGAAAWFPDGQHLIYTGYQEGEPFEVYDPYHPGTFGLFAIPMNGGPPRRGTDLFERAFPADATDPTVTSSLPWAELTRHLPSPPSTSTPTHTLPSGELYPLVALEDIAVADPRLNAAVIESYRAWREEVHEKTGWDYLGQLSDVLRVPGYVSRKPYGYLTWHKAGRAVDLRFELPNEEGRDQLLIVRDDIGQRTYWRLFIRCRPQDGSQGRPLTQRPWVFWFLLDEEKEPEAYEAGGRPTSIPSGYYEDFTAIARRHGWHRIPAFEEEDYDWRWDSLGREFWHYQNTDDLTWYQAMQQIYPEETLQALFNWPLCLERGQTEAVLRAKGVPTPTPTPSTISGATLRASATPANTPTRTPTPTGTPTASVPSQANITGISGRFQALPLDCESRSAVDWAAYFGVEIDELEFFYSLPQSDNPDKGFVGDVHGSWGQIPPKPYGVHAEPVAALLRAYGLDAQAVRDVSLDALRSEIAAGRPVIAWVTGQVAWGTPVPYTASDGSRTIVARYEHTVMVIGYNKHEVRILDGAQVYTRQWGDFERSWAVLGNMAVIMRPRGDEQHAGYKESF